MSDELDDAIEIDLALSVEPDASAAVPRLRRPGRGARPGQPRQPRIPRLGKLSPRAREILDRLHAAKGQTTHE